MTRSPYATRTIRLIGEAQRELAYAMLRNIPLDPDKPLELVLREESKARRLDQNAAMGVGPLRDIAEQAWVDGRQYSAEVWHEHFKRQYLPEDADPELSLLKNPETYHKWAITPSGEQVLIGSTTQLSVRGFAIYMLQVESCGAGLGVQFHTLKQP